MDRAKDMEVSEASSTGGDDSVWDLLSVARRLVDHGKPSEALQAVLTALQAREGSEAALRFLQRAREMYLSRLQESTAVDQLASLFAECAIAEVQSLKAEPAAPLAAAAPAPAQPVPHVNSILAESGRTQIVLDAFADGSSFICLKCGGLVSIHRKDEHYAYWCG